MITTLIVMGVLLMLWPQKKAEKTVEYDLSGYEVSHEPVREVSFSEAIACLAKVRERLERHEDLSGDEESAVEALTLALVRGSGK